MKKILIPVIVAAVLGITLSIHAYYPYFGLWDESKVPENLNKSEILSRAGQLLEVRLFLERYPDAEIKVDREHNQVKYVEEETVKTKYGDEKRRFYMQVQFDAFGNPFPYMIGCSGNNISTTETDNIMGKLQSDWCFKGDVMSMED